MRTTPLAILARAGLVVSLALATGGCALTLDARSLGAGVTVASPASPPPAGSEFHVSEKAVYILFGAITASEPSLQHVLAGQLGGGASIANLRVKVSSRFTDILVTLLTAGIIVPRTVTFEGVVVGGH